MSESRDSAIKLFGRTIPLQPNGEHRPITDCGGDGGGEEEKDLQVNEAPPNTECQDQELANSEGKPDPPLPPTPMDSSKPSPPDAATESSSPPEQKSSNTSSSEPKEKTLKKPDKILPCPRCKSMDTKFCYYNNYNVNQPRHFCKKCQRYWTAGGSMRNVPVGAGRRKNKNSGSHYRNLTVPSSSLRAVGANNSGTVLSFGSDAPVSESMASVLSIRDQTMKDRTLNRVIVAENGAEKSIGSAVIDRKNSEEERRINSKEKSAEKCPGISNQFPSPCLNGTAWAYNPFYAQSFAIPLYPAAYWGCAMPANWTIPWASNFAVNANSPTLGKHSRDGNGIKEDNTNKAGNRKAAPQEKCVWVPKTLRIDDLDEAAKSSIWAMVGIKNCERGSIFNAFRPKVDAKNYSAENSQLLHANPAAFSRSVNFHESS